MASPNKKKLTAVCHPELVERIYRFRDERGISTSEALSCLAEKGLAVVGSKKGGFLSAEAAALAEIFDKLDDQGRQLLTQAAGLMLERGMALEQVEKLERIGMEWAKNPERLDADTIDLVARNNVGGPIQKVNIIPFLVEQAQQSSEEL